MLTHNASVELIFGNKETLERGREERSVEREVETMYASMRS